MNMHKPPVIHSVEEYLTLPYTIEVHKDDSDGELAYVARVVGLPGCLTQADTFEEVEEMVQDAMRVWIESAREAGIPVPDPGAMSMPQTSGQRS